MSPRSYRLGRREATVEETRERVIAAARDVFSMRGFAQVSLDDVAEQAGVARATVYYQFTSKAGLVEAAVQKVAAENREGRLQRAREHPDPRMGVLEYLEGMGAMWERNRSFFQNIAGLALLEPEIAAVAKQYEERRREGLTWLVKRLQDAGGLQPDVSHKRAVDILWTLTSFRTYDHLRRYAGTSAKDTATVLRALALSHFTEA